MDRPLLVTIDGPAGAGKTTISRMLANRLSYRFIDTGALYRGIALQARVTGVARNDDRGLARMCENIDLSLVRRKTVYRLILNGVDISDQIRTPEITMLASAVSARPVIRQFLLGLQRDLGREGRAVFEGRDMGTVVFPDADVKFFLTASIRARARRRYEELAAGGPAKQQVSLSRVERDILRRDRNDTTRQLAPLKPGSGSIVIDSTGLSPDQVVEEMLIHVRRALRSPA